eukprot:199892_1
MEDKGHDHGQEEEEVGGGNDPQITVHLETNCDERITMKIDQRDTIATIKMRLKGETPRLYKTKNRWIEFMNTDNVDHGDVLYVSNEPPTDGGFGMEWVRCSEEEQEEEEEEEEEDSQRAVLREIQPQRMNARVNRLHQQIQSDDVIKQQLEEMSIKQEMEESVKKQQKRDITNSYEAVTIKCTNNGYIVDDMPDLDEDEDIDMDRDSGVKQTSSPLPSNICPLCSFYNEPLYLMCLMCRAELTTTDHDMNTNNFNTKDNNQNDSDEWHPRCEDPPKKLKKNKRKRNRKRKRKKEDIGMGPNKKKAKVSRVSRVSMSKVRFIKEIQDVVSSSIATPTIESFDNLRLKLCEKYKDIENLCTRHNTNDTWSNEEKETLKTMMKKQRNNDAKEPQVQSFRRVQLALFNQNTEKIRTIASIRRQWGQLNKKVKKGKEEADDHEENK